MVLGIGTVFSAISSIAVDSGARDDDMVDRLNHMVMYGLLIFLAVASGTRQYVGTAIYCWAPAEYSEKYHRRYINHYCWVNPVYSIPFNETVPIVEDDRYFNDVSFYKLATALFLVLAVLFRIPQLLWKGLKGTSGANLEELIGLTVETTLMDQDKRDEQLSKVAEYIHRWLTSPRVLERNGSTGSLGRTLAYLTRWGQRSGNRLVYSYLLMKFVYIVNVIGQFFIVSAFLKTNYWKLGFNALDSYVKHGKWEDTYNFPRVAHCDFKMRQLNNVHTYTVQCVLAINLFLEKMFLLLWFCLIVVMIINVISFSQWVIQLLNETQRVRFLWKYFGKFLPRNLATTKDKHQFFSMLRRYLKADGVFVIRMIEVNSTDMMTYDLVRQIWIRYKTSRDAEVAERGVKMNGSVVPALYNKEMDKEQVLM